MKMEQMVEIDLKPVEYIIFCEFASLKITTQENISCIRERFFDMYPINHLGDGVPPITAQK
jgi:hypothetical protein